jgi:anthranilate synthase component 1
VAVMQSIPLVHDYAHALPLGKIAAHILIGLHEKYPDTYPALLQSAAATAGTYDVLMAFPSGTLTLTGDGCLTQLNRDIPETQFLHALDIWWNQSVAISQPTTLPFSGGWFVYLGYELAGQIESTVCVAQGTRDEITAQAMRIPVAIVRDASSHDAWLVFEHEYRHLVETVQVHLQREVSTTPSTKLSGPSIDLNEERPEKFIDVVRRVKECIAAGDIYQANLSRGWQTTLPDSMSATSIYQQLCAVNPSPFAGLVKLSNGDYIISSSPERLIRVRNNVASTRPIAGTRPRSPDQHRDMQLIDELRQHPKEQAEHIMLLDLERNDLGRLCLPGTVRVDEYMTVESYAHVHHIVSNVFGRLRPEVTPGQAIAAVFPGGTITGCPKVRCMQIIAELEGVRRGAYTGSMGYLNRDGSMDLNILIRTLQLHYRQLEFRAGAGIVADSVSEKELEETRAKALGMIRALGVSC